LKITADGHELFGVEAVLYVPDVAITLAFYRDVLGFNVDFESGSPPVHARVSSGDPASPATARIRFELTSAPLGEARSCYLYVYVGHALDDLFAAYQDRGVEIVDGPRVVRGAFASSKSEIAMDTYSHSRRQLLVLAE
jgi:catechol 2,3-dioxygenase-like lactoylglutathione lyase family enzyme